MVSFRRMLSVKINDSPKRCLLLDGISRGKVVALSNLVFCRPQKYCGQAIANQYSIVSLYPRLNFLQKAVEEFKSQLPEVHT